MTRMAKRALEIVAMLKVQMAREDACPEHEMVFVGGVGEQELHVCRHCMYQRHVRLTTLEGTPMMKRPALPGAASRQ